MNFLNEHEQKALTELCNEKDMSEEAVMRHALRVYQFVDSYMKQDMELAFFDRKTHEYFRPLNHSKLAPYEPEGK